MQKELIHLQHWKEIIIDIAQQAGLLLKACWQGDLEVQKKTHATDLVTIADKQADALITSLLSKYFPTHQILAEESGVSGLSSDWLWAIDPLDGTTNYAHHFPVFAVSIGLLYKKMPVLGVIYQPTTDEMYCAVHGGGATLNDMPLHVSRVTNLHESLLATGFPYNRLIAEPNATNYSQFCRLTHLTQGVRRLGSAALDLAYVAAGRLDGYWEQTIKTWDVAAGIVLVREAGGIVSDYDLQPFQWDNERILATNGPLHNMISQELCATT